MMNTLTRSAAALALAAALLTACQPSAEQQVAAKADPHAGLDLPPGHPDVALPGDGSAPANSALTNSNPGHPPVIGLDGEGLRLIDPKSGANRELGFGIGEAQLKTVTEKLKGRAETGRNQECGAGPLSYISWSDGLTLYALDGLFAGWSLDESGATPTSTGAATKRKVAADQARLTTVSGIGIGSTRAELLDVYDAKIEETTLGTEFNAAGLSGILDGKGPKAKVTNLWSGVNCVFR